MNSDNILCLKTPFSNSKDTLGDKISNDVNAIVQELDSQNGCFYLVIRKQTMTGKGRMAKLLLQMFS